VCCRAFACAVAHVQAETMTFTRLPSEPPYGPPGGPAEHRRKVQQDADERASLRGIELESQASSMKDPQERIGIWERLHALRLPRAPGHVLVKVIAKQTRLTVAQVREEQQRRAGALSPHAAASHAHVGVEAVPSADGATAERATTGSATADLRPSEG
jgi:hypothetical protein